MVQVHKWRDGDRGEGVGSDPPPGHKQPAGSVAETAAGQAGELGVVAYARGERGLGLALAGGVAQGAGGQLLGAGDSGGSVAPGGPQRAFLAAVAFVQLIAGEDLRPPRAARGVPFPVVEPLADAHDRRVLPVDLYAVDRGQRHRPVSRRRA